MNTKQEVDEEIASLHFLDPFSNEMLRTIGVTTEVSSQEGLNSIVLFSFLLQDGRVFTYLNNTSSLEIFLASEKLLHLTFTPSICKKADNVLQASNLRIQNLTAESNHNNSPGYYRFNPTNLTIAESKPTFHCDLIRFSFKDDC